MEAADNREAPHKLRDQAVADEVLRFYLPQYTARNMSLAGSISVPAAQAKP